MRAVLPAEPGAQPASPEPRAPAAPPEPRAPSEPPPAPLEPRAPAAPPGTHAPAAPPPARAPAEPRRARAVVGDFPDPEAGPGEVLVAVEAAGLNPADRHQLRGHYPPPPGESPVPGLEAAGRIAALGPGVEGWRLGDRVMALLGGGGQAERVAVPAGQLMALPGELSFVEGGALPEAGLTAWTNLVVEGGLKAGDNVLVTGATGGVGSFAVQLARALGARVFAAVRDRARGERLRDLGVEHVLVDGEDLPRQVEQATGGRGVDLVLDLVAGKWTAGHLAALAPRGRLVVVGVLAAPRGVPARQHEPTPADGRGEVDWSVVLRRRLRIAGSLLRSRPRTEKAELVAAFSAFALPLLASRSLRAVVDRVVPLEHAAAAYDALAHGRPFGKIVLTMT